MNLRRLHLGIAVIVLAASGYVHGRWTNRWNNAGDVHGINLLDAIDRDIGDWRAGDYTKVNPAEMPVDTRCDTRRFVPLRGGKTIMVSLTSGSPKTVAVHTPDVCYLGAGWKLRGSVTKQTVPLSQGSNAEFYLADFVKSSVSGSETIRVRWTWTSDGTWGAPNYPRFTYAGSPILWKLYMVHPISDDDDLTREDPYRAFAADLMPILSRQVR